MADRVASPQGEDLGFDSGETHPRDPSHSLRMTKPSLSSRTSRLCLSSRTSGATEGPAFEFGLTFFVILRSGFGDEESAPDFGFVNCKIPRP